MHGSSCLALNADHSTLRSDSVSDRPPRPQVRLPPLPPRRHHACHRCHDRREDRFHRGVRRRRQGLLCSDEGGRRARHCRRDRPHMCTAGETPPLRPSSPYIPLPPAVPMPASPLPPRSAYVCGELSLPPRPISIFTATTPTTHPPGLYEDLSGPSLPALPMLHSASFTSIPTPSPHPPGTKVRGPARLGLPDPTTITTITTPPGVHGGLSCPAPRGLCRVR